jgi:hypothetical protein
VWGCCDYQSSLNATRALDADLPWVQTHGYIQLIAMAIQEQIHHSEPTTKRPGSFEPGRIL